MLKSTKLLKKVWAPLKLYVRNNPFPVQFMHLLRNLPPTQYTTLSNCLRVVSEERDSCAVCIGMYMDAGSRYESDFENGAAHFFEHIAFKSTNNRDRRLLEEQMEATGAQFSCFTTREMCGYFVQCLSKDVPCCFDILADCVYNNAFSDMEIEQQKKVVFEEMQDHDEDPNAVLDDYLHQTAFQGTPLGKTVMGTSCSVPKFDSGIISRYIGKYFDPTRTVLVAVGGVNHEQIVCLAETYLGKYKATRCHDRDPYRFTGSEIRYRNDSMPVGCVAMAVEGPCMCDEDSVVMEVAANVIGGWDRSQTGAENHSSYVARAASVGGLADAFRAFNLTYKDTGLWGIKVMGNTLNLDDMVQVVQDQWMSLCNMITDAEVERARRFLKTKLLSRNESLCGSCQDIGRWVLYYGHRPPLHEQMCLLDGVFAPEVRKVATKYLYDKCPAVAAVGATEGLPDYTRLRAGMYWLRV